MVAMKVEKTIKVGRPALNRAMVRRTLSAAVLAPHKALSSRFPNFISTRPPAALSRPSENAHIVGIKILTQLANENMNQTFHGCPRNASVAFTPGPPIFHIPLCIRRIPA